MSSQDHQEYINANQELDGFFSSLQWVQTKFMSQMQQTQNIDKSNIFGRIVKNEDVPSEDEEADDETPKVKTTYFKGIFDFLNKDGKCQPGDNSNKSLIIERYKRPFIVKIKRPSQSQSSKTPKGPNILDICRQFKESERDIESSNKKYFVVNLKSSSAPSRYNTSDPLQDILNKNRSK